MDRRRAGRSLTAYSRWGFIATERPSISAPQQTLVGRYDAATRRRIRHALAERKPEFKMSEYLAALDHAITRQQAYQELRRDPDFETTGRGREAHWRRSHSKPSRANRP
jgi:hypothetical protein